ncbi:MAG: hypothetical protein ABH876_01520 [Patescibacteria group bacterium]|nr:hypothetical protein [Patescibacteria group bacterium]
MIEINIKKRWIPKIVLKLVFSYLIDKASDEQKKAFLEDWYQHRFYRKYSLDELIEYFKSKRPNRGIQSLVPIILDKSYERPGCDSPSTQMFADIAYEILKMERPRRILKKTPLAKTIVDFIQKDLAKK